MSLTNASPELAARAAKISSRTLGTLSENARNQALDAIYDALVAARDDILAANAVDLEKAKQSTANGELNPSILKRLDLSRKGKFDDMLQGIKDVRGLPDPGRCPHSTHLPHVPVPEPEPVPVHTYCSLASSVS
jgi:glutamate-5-semialdehyde dehydrogenase